MDLKDLMIGVFKGGDSPEREISLASGRNVVESLKECGYKVVDIDLNTRDKNEIVNIVRSNSIDLVFIALHGEFGEDGQIQKIFEDSSILFTGSGSKASSLAMNKIKTRKVLEEESLPLPKAFTGIDEICPSDFPLVLKPSSSGSSIGVKIVKDIAELEEGAAFLNKSFPEILIEEYIPGRELTVGILGEKPLPVVEIVFENSFFDYSCKYTDDLSRAVVPVDIPDSLSKEIQRVALQVYKALGGRHFGRVDFRLSKDMKPYVLELNSIPGLTSHSLLPLAAKNIGIDFSSLCEGIVREAFSGLSVSSPF